MENIHREECFYNGHRICVEAEELAAGAWSWNYVVVGELIASKGAAETASNPEVALKDGMAEARGRVDAVRGASLTLLAGGRRA